MYQSCVNGTCVQTSLQCGGQCIGGTCNTATGQCVCNAGYRGTFCEIGPASMSLADCATHWPPSFQGNADVMPSSVSFCLFRAHARPSRPIAVCRIPDDFGPLVVGQTCTAGMYLRTGTSCTVQCQAGATPVAGSNAYSCGNDGVLSQVASLTCVSCMSLLCNRPTRFPL
jgi:hypothetical protein